MMTMDSARADALFARERIARLGWIARNAEDFRHLPPPAAEVWLGEADAGCEQACDASPLAGAGWTLHPLGQRPPGRVEARWLDAADPDQRAELFAGLVQPGDGVDADDAAPLAWAHRALCRQGLRVRIGGEAGAARHRETVWLQLRRQPRSAVEAPLLVIEVAAGVQCVLVESHDRIAASDDQGIACERDLVQNMQVHVRLEQGAALQHLRVVAPGAGDRIVHHIDARLAAASRYEQAMIASGSSYHLQRTVVELQGAKAEARSAAVLFAAHAALEQQVRVAHVGDASQSSVEALALADAGARIVVNAYSRIAPGADEAALRQKLVGIPTGGQPKIVLRPHLEIHHDKVQAAHGATWGAMPEEAIFYACQRGIEERDARAMIVHGMAHAVLARGVDDPELLESLGVEALLERAVADHLAASARQAAPPRVQEAPHG
jgi:Fe-S cluster assembly protein SufD